MYAISHRSTSSTYDGSTKNDTLTSIKVTRDLESLYYVLILKPKFSSSTGFSWLLSLGLLLSLTLSFNILGINEESCFSFLRFIDVSPAEMANLMLQGLLARWEVCSLFDERAVGNKQGQMLNTVKLNDLICLLWEPLILFLLLRIKILIEES